MKIILLLLLIVSPRVFADQQQFFSNFSKLCGKSFAGKTKFPAKPSTPFDQPLKITVSQCNSKEIRVPFLVGKDTSRTWVLTKLPDGLQLKHDHRHKDGTPHELTFYGGLATASGSAMQQSFPADSLTHKLVPEGKSNVWTLTIDWEKQTLTYFLERHAKPRYRAVFDLTQDKSDLDQSNDVLSRDK